MEQRNHQNPYSRDNGGKKSLKRAAIEANAWADRIRAERAAREAADQRREAARAAQQA